jgi:guanylate kinase
MSRATSGHGDCQSAEAPRPAVRAFEPQRCGQVDHRADDPGGGRRDRPVGLGDDAADAPGEVDGEDYHFVSNEEFDELISTGEFLEWAHVFGHRYGTLKREVVKQIESGRDVLLDIDWQGTQQLKQVDPDIVRVFILPPSVEELERRLRYRGTDADEVIERRMARAAVEISHWAEYDYVFINDDAEHCRKLVHTVLKAERLKATRRIFLHDFVRSLIG